MKRPLIAITLTLTSSSAAFARDGICHKRDGAGAETDCQATPPPLVSAPSGMGQYCSITYEASGGGFFTWSTSLSGDPCDGLLGPGGQTKHAGMYSLSGKNIVIERCTDGYVKTAQGVGSAPMLELYNDAANHARPACDFLVSPFEFPVFDAPFRINNIATNGFSHGTGFDHALWPGALTFNMRDDFNIPSARTQVFTMDQDGKQRDGSVKANLQIGTGVHTLGSLTSLVVDTTAGFDVASFANPKTIMVANDDGGEVQIKYRGMTGTSFTNLVIPADLVNVPVKTGGIVIKPFGWIDDHQGHDFGLNEGADILAPADGVIDVVRRRSYPSCSADPQGEIYIRHRFSGGKALYDEVYETYYAHWKAVAINPATHQAWKAGDVVHRGDTIAQVGMSGCASGFHVHFGVFRLSNTASALNYPIVINTAPNNGGPNDPGSDLGYRNAIDPGGFTPPNNDSFDPWAYKGTDETLWCGSDSTKSDQSCDRGAPSPILWRPGQTPPRNEDRGGSTW